jgi:hypothetical protein
MTKRTWEPFQTVSEKMKRSSKGLKEFSITARSVNDRYKWIKLNTITIYYE